MLIFIRVASMLNMVIGFHLLWILISEMVIRKFLVWLDIFGADVLLEGPIIVIE